MSRNQHQPPRTARNLVIAPQQPTVAGVRVVDLANDFSLHPLP
jgi:hypothetical protein